jgi:hypothetical protein
MPTKIVFENVRRTWLMDGVDGVVDMEREMVGAKEE